MTGPLTSSARHRWLLRYIAVQKRADKRIFNALRNASKDLDEAMKDIEEKEARGVTVSGGLRRSQLLSSKGVITRIISTLYSTIGDTVKSSQEEAAAAAAEQAFEDQERIWRLIEPNEDKRNLLRDTASATAERQVQATMTRILDTKQPLSKRIYKAQSNTQMKVAKTVNIHLAKGSSAAVMARDLRQYFNPNVPGGVNYAASRLARTEINNAFHAQAIADAQQYPWVEYVEWHLSKSHPARQPECMCDQYAEQKIFATNNVPNKPHPNCLCYIVPVIPTQEVAEQMVKQGQYVL